MKNEDSSQLIEKYLIGTASEEEKEQLLTWYRSRDHSEVEWPAESETEEENVYHRIFSNIEDQIGDHNNPSLTTEIPVTATEHNIPLWPGKWSRIAVAAAIVAISAVSIYWFTTNTTAPKEQVLAFKNDVSPGGNKAILKLGDGTQILLDDVSGKTIANQAGISITKTADGQLVYNTSASHLKDEAEKPVAYNSISTPTGGQYRVILPDGSKIWLNASSSIRFPTVFRGTERKVEISGEVYFEVIKNKDMPFKVIAEQQELSVLGTHFNINAYKDEEHISTTLIEGSVKVNRINSTSSNTLKPGQQSQMTNGNSNTPVKVVEADVEEVTGWKNGVFTFNNTPITTVMQEIERWYDVELSYLGKKPDLYFTGVIPRNSNLSTFLKVLEGTGGVKFGIEGKRIIIKTIK